LREIRELLTVAIYEAVWNTLAAQYPWLRLPLFKQIGQFLVARAIAQAIAKHSDVPWKTPVEARDHLD